MESLERRVEPVKELEIGDIIEGVRVIDEEYCKNQKVYIYKPEIFPDIKGIIFPNDDIVSIGQLYNVVINRISKKYCRTIILSEIYHNYKKLFNREIPVKISKLSDKNQPMFEIYGYRGFVIKGKANIGDKIKVKVLSIISGNQREDFLKTEVISHIE